MRFCFLFLFSFLAVNGIAQNIPSSLEATFREDALLKVTKVSELLNVARESYLSEGPQAYSQKIPGNFTMEERVYIAKQLKSLPEIPLLSVKDNDLVLNYSNGEIINLDSFDVAKGVFRFEGKVYIYRASKDFIFNFENWKKLGSDEVSFLLNRFFNGMFIPQAEAKKSTKGMFIGGLFGAILGGWLFPKVMQWFKGGSNEEAVAKTSAGATPTAHAQGPASSPGAERAARSADATPSPGANSDSSKAEAKTTKKPKESTPVVDSADYDPRTKGLKTEDTKKFIAFSSEHEFSSNKDKILECNKGEDFTSLGIGHYLWYSASTSTESKKYTESFPELVDFMQKNDTCKGLISANPAVKDIIFDKDGKLKQAPWSPNKEGNCDSSNKFSKEIKQLKDFLWQDKVIACQAAFQESRIKKTIADLESKLDEKSKQFLSALSKTRRGFLALMDYVNFKGEGFNSKEVYVTKDGKQHQWGLKQVVELASKSDNTNPLGAFIDSATTILAERADNDKAIENKAEAKDSWLERVRAYASL